MPVQKTLVNDCIKDRKRKGFKEDYLVCEFANFTCISIFFTCRKDTERKGFAEDLTVFAPRYFGAQQPLSSHQFSSHEP